MSINTNERVAAVVTVVTDGNLEILNRDPFVARVTTPGAPVFVETFLFEPADTTVVELCTPIARVLPSSALDRWIARVAPRLFNVHVAAVDSADGTIVEARTSLIADGLTIEILGRSLALLAAGAALLDGELSTVLTPLTASATNGHASSAPSAVGPQVVNGGPDAAPVAFAGYL